ncbi:MAG: hypothetical protein IJQ34_03220 [Kiritimatiellae bacterium]|nr:hypothetical protein [Kiritimatiellia bacterium]MBR0197122.1 hypothetical protein [Kiritimatiellia bacterium]
MPAVRTIARPPLSDSVMIHIPEEYRSYSLEIVIMPVMDVPHRPKPKYDFSDLVGKLHFEGDPVAFQRSLRDEW